MYTYGHLVARLGAVPIACRKPFDGSRLRPVEVSREFNRELAHREGFGGLFGQALAKGERRCCEFRWCEDFVNESDGYGLARIDLAVGEAHPASPMRSSQPPQSASSSALKRVV